MRNDRLSATALLIAKSQLVLAHDPALSWAVGPDRARIYRACVSAALGREWSPSAVTRTGYAIAERLSVPGIYLHYALRKLEIARIVDALIRERGVGQVVVVAAGFDPLCALLHPMHPAVRWYEIDHPATQRHKRGALSTLPTGDNLTLLPIDLTRESLADLFYDVVVTPGIWDGIFIDVYCKSILWMETPTEHIDFVRAGYPSLAAFDAAWAAVLELATDLGTVWHAAQPL